ncbi:MAG: molybdopterin biosynthesis protein [Syntrophus sp. (in: bacteria)]|nr:molybdopterin biosynthesis protein [Syntrophus sp. (in: bacteria)]
MKRYLKTLTTEEALSKILAVTGHIEDEEELAVHQCMGRITTRPLFAQFSNPPFLCAAMDGYSVSFERTLGADLAHPMDLPRSHVDPVNTGDLLRRGANAVIMIEDVEEQEAHITIRKPVYLWQNVRMVGEDVIEGDMLLPVNHSITTFDVGMLVSAGITHAYVRKRPRMAVIPTGKELIDIFKERFDPQGEPRLIDFNSYTLKCMAEETGFEFSISAIARTKDDLRAAVRHAIGTNDVVLINAGSSAGREDYTEEIIGELGTIIFHGVSMMPGKPAMFGLIDGKPVFGVPGYPVSAVMTFRTFLVPLFEKLMNTKKYGKTVTCEAAYKIPSRVGIEEMLRVNLIENKGIYHAIPLPRGASLFSSMAKADGIVIIPENLEGYDESEKVACQLLRDEGEITGRIHIIGSHDLSLDVMRDLLKSRHPGTDLISTHTGSLSGIMALKKGITPLATTHILDEKEQIYNIPVIKKYLPETAVKLIHIAKRTQGLLVANDNPKNLTSVADLTRPGVRSVNRQFGSGTRILFDAILAKEGLHKDDINGYDREESSHTAVGILVRESIADAGVGIYSVAKAFSLGFIPLAEEEYDLLVTNEFTTDSRFVMLMDILLSAQFKERLLAMGGYNMDDTGKVKYEQNWS